MEFLNAHLAWLKVIHVFAAFAWMAGMLYLPRLFVYHTDCAPGAADYARFVLMERRLLRGIINPSMMVVWVVGLLLAYLSGVYHEIWFALKFALVLLLSGLHGAFASWFKAFARGENRHSARFFRLWNEVPALFLIGILIMVLVRPF